MLPTQEVPPAWSCTSYIPVSATLRVKPSLNPLPPVYSALNCLSEAHILPQFPHRTILFALTCFIPLLADDQSGRSRTRQDKLKENPTCELNDVFSLHHLFTLKLALTNSIKLLWSSSGKCNDKRLHSSQCSKDTDSPCAVSTHCFFVCVPFQESFQPSVRFSTGLQTKGSFLLELLLTYFFKAQAASKHQDSIYCIFRAFFLATFAGHATYTHVHHLYLCIFFCISQTIFSTFFQLCVSNQKTNLIAEGVIKLYGILTIERQWLHDQNFRISDLAPPPPPLVTRDTSHDHHHHTALVL